MSGGLSQFSLHLKRACLFILPLLLVAILGVTHLHDPLTGDQALYLIGAKEIAKGAVLYVDFWCNKQPGNYLFFCLGGKLFGFSEVGVHAFELLYFILFAILLGLILRPYFENHWLASLVPLATIGVYYATVDPWLLTQLEILVAFPTFLSLWLCSLTPSSRLKNFLEMMLSGVFAAITIIFKLILAPIFPLFWLISSIIFIHKKYLNLKQTIWYRFIPAALGVFLILGAISWWYWSHHALKELYWVSFVWPLKAVAKGEQAPFSRLLKGITITGEIYGLWLGLSVVALVQWKRVRRQVVTPLLFSWIAIGALIVLAQRLSWWWYHFLLFYLPVGILGMAGVDDLLALRQKNPRYARIPKSMLAGILVLFASLPSINLWQKHARIWISERPYIDQVHREAYQFKKSKTYEKIWHDTRFLVAPEAIPGRIYVFGDPTYLYLSGRRYAVPMQPWGLYDAPRKLWDELYPQLSRASPPYIFVDNIYKEQIAQKSPLTKKWIEDDYEHLKDNFEGTWYKHK